MTLTQERFASVATGVRLCYCVDGPADGPALLLLGGLGEDMSSWSDAFVSAMVSRGYRVVRHDNRDAGRSSRIDRRPPAPWRLLSAKPQRDAYTLAQMARDSVSLLDHLGIDRAHIVGRSMGGMIAQSLAAHHGDRTASLTSIYSTTGALTVGQPTLKTRLMLIASPPAKTRERAIKRHLKLTHQASGTAYPLNEAAEAVAAGILWDRAGGPNNRGTARQIQCIQASGDRTSELHHIDAPTLVLNGDRDQFVDPSGGRATATAITNARHVVVPGMGHHIHDDLVALVAVEIDAHISSVEERLHSAKELRRNRQ
ncbi:alpha/beta fold hydrolase [Streptomyces canus]|uniref:alpha/beta fold hydrolase n=1 Tax=Streptomyces canus TaxID=58343 RepID=UPI000360ED4A|nr:alpha/beta fold hydrolase [Streptomyces canus]